MKGVFGVVRGLSQYMYWVAGVCLACLMFLTVTDVILRFFNRPITGVYDLTVLFGGIIVGLAVPLSTLKKVHVCMTFFTDIVSPGWVKAFMAITRCLGIGLFFLFGWTLMRYGLSMYRGGETSLTIHLPLYPVVLAIGVACFINALVLVHQLVLVFRREEA